MARGRMISKDITMDKRINDLSCNLSRLAYTWLIPFADCEGRCHGDPVLVRNILFPRRFDVTPEMIEGYLQEWHDCELITWYEAKGDKWVHFSGFDKNQKIRKDREAPSAIPTPPLRTNSGLTPDEIQVKLKEIKGIEVKEEESLPPNFSNINHKQAMELPEIALYKEVTNRSPGMPEMQDIYRRLHGTDFDVGYLSRFWNKWVTSKSKDGRPYRMDNPAWLDWALSGDIPMDKTKLSGLEGMRGPNG